MSFRTRPWPSESAYDFQNQPTTFRTIPCHWELVYGIQNETTGFRMRPWPSVSILSLQKRPSKSKYDLQNRKTTFTIGYDLQKTAMTFTFKSAVSSLAPIPLASDLYNEFDKACTHTHTHTYKHDDLWCFGDNNQNNIWWPHVQRRWDTHFIYTRSTTQLYHSVGHYGETRLSVRRRTVSGRNSGNVTGMRQHVK